MGQRQNQTEIEYGNNCALKFPAGETPKYLYARFILIEACPLATALPPNDRAFKLTQAPGAPCLWRYNIAPWYIWMEYIQFPVSTRLHITHTPSGKHYFTNQVIEYTDEGYVFTSEYLICGGQNWGIKGIGVVTWRLESISILESFNIDTAPNLFMEMRPLVDGKRVYKYCRLRDATNIKILLDS